MAEIWGALEGIQFDVARGFSTVELNVDYAVVAGILAGRPLRQHGRKEYCLEVKLIHSLKECVMFIARQINVLTFLP